MAETGYRFKKIIGPGNKGEGRMAGKPPALILFASLVLLTFFRFLPAAETPYVWMDVRKIIAVGDLHGDYDNFIEILKNPKVGLVDDNLHWAGGKTHFVQMGDIMDRGDKAKKILELLMRLEEEAEAAGGKVHILLGNHEEATISGISLSYPNYVFARQFVSFLPEDFRKAREKKYLSQLPADDLARVQTPGGDIDKDPNLLNFWDGVLKEVRKGNDPEAALAYVQNFNQKYGKWLARKNCVIKINDTIFVHGGISLQYSTWKLKDINELLSLELGAIALRPKNPQLGGLPLQPKLVYNAQSPLWYRQDGVASQAEIDEILANLGAGRIVVGHNFLGAGGGSPIIRREDDVAQFENKVWMIDTGIGYSDLGGILYALIIDNGEFDFFASSPEAKGQSPEENPVGEGPQTPDEVEKYLRISVPLVVIPGAAGRTEPWKVKMASGGITRWAQFKYINRPRPDLLPDSFKYELAAYELNKYLGLSFVPPAVARIIKETPGSLQAFIDNVIRESDLKRDSFLPGGLEALDQALADLKVFENLVFDSCENDKDTLIQKDTGKLYRVDFSEAFAPEAGTVPGCEIRRCSRRVYQKLLAWDQDEVRVLLAPYLNQEEFDALNARREAIIKIINKQIEERGEAAVLF